MQTNTDHIIRDCCEAEVAEFGKPDTICITVDDLREIVQRHSPGQCLHQIQEPSSAEQAAWHAGLDEGRTQAAPAAVAVPDERAAFEATNITGRYYRSSEPGCADEYADPHTQLAWKSWQARAALDATPAAAAPVVLPEPASLIAEKLLALARIVNTAVEDWGESSEDNSMDVKFHSDVVTEMDAILDYFDSLPDGPDENVIESGPAKAARILRALLAGVSAPAAQAEPVAWTVSGEVTNWSRDFSKYKTQHYVRPVFTAPQAPAFQQRVQPWMMACFGPEISADRIERNHRFLEESLELVQSLGCTASEAHQLVDYVFGRPVGEPVQEAGGVMVTLAALCLASGLDMHACGETELARIWTKVEAIRAKQAAKPKHSPLPMHAPQTQDALQQVRQAVRDFHYALDSRTHGGVAAGAAMNAIEMALNMYWQQGQEADRRAAIAAQAAKGEEK